MNSSLEHLKLSHSEEQVLHGFIFGNPSFKAQATIIQPAIFTDSKHATILKAIHRVIDAGCEVDNVSVIEDLKQNQELEQAGGIVYINGLGVDYVSINADQCLKLLKAAYYRRELVRVLSDGASQAGKVENPIESVLDSVKIQLNQLTKLSMTGKIRDSELLLKDLKEKTVNNKKVEFIKSGVKRLDETIDGLRRGDLIVLAADTGIGKTTFALNIAYNVAHQGYPVFFVSMEMSGESVMGKIISRLSQVDSRKIHNQNYTNGERDKVIVTLDNLDKMKFFIGDRLASIQQISEEARKLAQDYNLGLIVVDYLQLVETRNVLHSEYDRVTSISKALKGLAVELDVPVLAISQLSREGKLRSSGQIDQDAGIIIMLTEKDKETMNVRVKKNRHGNVGGFDLEFDRATSSFRDRLDPDEYHQGVSKLDEID